MTYNDWRKVKLKNITTDGRGFYGIGASGVDYDEDLLTYLRITDITDDGFINKDKLMSVKDEKAEDYLLKENDIVFARTGNSTGRSYLYEAKDGDLVYAGFLIRFNLDEEKVNPRYIKYYTISQEYRDWVNSFSTGSTRKNINAKIYGEMEINLPSRKYQDWVVEKMDSVTNKILINNQMNETLEEMAQAIFKHWFVDFEFPNENGEPYKSSGGKFVESELGMIPDEWEVGIVADLGEVVGGATPSRKREDYFTKSGIPWITPRDLSDNPNKFISKGSIDITEEGYKNSSVRILPKGTVLFSSRAPIGYLAIAKNDVTTNQGFKSVVPKDKYGSEFVYQLLKSNLELIESRASGSTFKEISGKGLKEIPIVIPCEEIIREFNNTMNRTTGLIEQNEEAIEVLINIRDILLPKLMSGEIRIPDAEKEVEACLQKNS